MTVQDILKRTNDRVLVMDEANTFKIIAKVQDDETKIVVGYERDAVMNMIVKGIQSSGSSLMLTVNSMEGEGYDG